MVDDDKEITGGHGWDSNCGKEPKVEDNDKNWLLLNGSSGGATFGEATYAEEFRFRFYKRTKRRKISGSDEMKMSGFRYKIKSAHGNAFDNYVHRLSLDTFPNGPGECSLRKCSNAILNQTHQSLNGHEGCIQNAHVTYQESGRTPLIKEFVNNVERSDNQTYNSAQAPSHVLSNGLLKQLEGSTNSDLCGHALSDILKSDIFSDLRGLLIKKFGVVNVNRVVNVNAISSKLKNGAYETSPVQYFKDIQKVFTKLQQVGNEMVTLAKRLSDKSRARYEQFVRKPTALEARCCQACGEKVEVKNCLVCDSCEDVYHISCTELVGTPVPPKSWYCAICVSNGIGSLHDHCVVCEKLKCAASRPLVNGAPTTNQSQDKTERLDGDVPDESQRSKICFICKHSVKMEDNFRICGHSLCAHEFYHYECLTSKELGLYGPFWYCPSCLCRHCLVDKDDDQIVLCDGCDHAYHTYCTSPQLNCVPKGHWFCGNCELKKIRDMKRVYENIEKKVKIEDESEKDEHEASVIELEGLDMLVTAAKTLSNEDMS